MRPALFLLFFFLALGSTSADVVFLNAQDIALTVPDSFQQLPPRDYHDWYVGQDGQTYIFLSFLDEANLPLDAPQFVNDIRGELQATGCILQPSQFIWINSQRFLVTRFVQPKDETDGICYVIVANNQVIMFTYAGHNLGDAVVANSADVMSTFRFIRPPIVPAGQMMQIVYSVLNTLGIAFIMLLLVAIYMFFAILRDSVREVLKASPFFTWVYG